MSTTHAPYYSPDHDHAMAHGIKESTALLGAPQDDRRGPTSSDTLQTTAQERQPKRSGEEAIGYAVLPIALLVALGMAATSATTIFAYADILCEDAAHCKGSEQSAYAGTVALATVVANVWGLLSIGPYEQLIKANRKAGLACWLLFRALSVAVLAFGVYRRNIKIAISGRFFEGLATDNILHFNLNAIYVCTPKKEAIPRLLGTSLTLYMLGMSLSPTIVGFFPSFVTSFLVALSIFAVALIYLIVFVHNFKPPPSLAGPSIGSRPFAHGRNHPSKDTKASLYGIPHVLSVFFRPLLVYYQSPHTLPHGICMLLYNSVQAYLFPAIMVHTALRFGFTSDQNGWIVSIAAGTSAVYLFTVLYAIPIVAPFFRDHIRGSIAEATETHKAKRVLSSDFIYAAISVVTEIAAISGLQMAAQPWQVYPFISLSALGLAAPSFIKSQFITFVDNAAQAVAALAMAESIGGLVSPAILGTWQREHPGGGVFFFAAGILGAALVFLVAGTVLMIVMERDPAQLRPSTPEASLGDGLDEDMHV